MGSTAISCSRSLSDASRVPYKTADGSTDTSMHRTMTLATEHSPERRSSSTRVRTPSFRSFSSQPPSQTNETEATGEETNEEKYKEPKHDEENCNQ